MSESDLSARLPGPVTGRPRRPLSNSASTASCSIRFSLLMMISGAPRSSSRFNRLFRLITRRYRSLRSDVANHAHGRVDRAAVVTLAVERRHDLQALDRLRLALTLGGGDRLLELDLH